MSEVLTASIALMVEALNTSETSVNFYETTQCNIPEGYHLHTRRRENLKFYLVESCRIYNIYIFIIIRNAKDQSTIESWLNEVF
jgi:hypothetical protein